MRASVAFLLLCTLASCSRADTWPPPTLNIVASPDGTALLRITPNFREGENSKALATVLRYDAPSGDYRKVAEFPLRNNSSPHEAVITNDGRFVVTFDDWAAMGRTENVVVVYRGDGAFVKAWALQDIFTAEERKLFASSTTSTSWRGKITLLEARSRDPIVFIQQELQQPDQGRKVEKTVLFNVAKLTFQTK